MARRTHCDNIFAGSLKQNERSVCCFVSRRLDAEQSTDTDCDTGRAMMFTSAFEDTWTWQGTNRFLQIKSFSKGDGRLDTSNMERRTFEFRSQLLKLFHVIHFFGFVKGLEHLVAFGISCATAISQCALKLPW